MPLKSIVPGGGGETDRLITFTRVLALSALFCLAFCWKLWLTRAIYPMVPVGGLLPELPAPFDGFALGMLAALLLGVAIWPTWRWGIRLIPVGFAFFFLQDQNRVWPSFYQFSVLFVLLSTYRPSVGQHDAERVLAGMRFVLAAIYFWAGVHKLNPYFFHQEFPWFLEPITSRLPLEVAFLPSVAPVAAVLELMVGVGLLTARFRRPAFVGALLMHSLILCCIGPLRDNWSNSSWAWGMTVAVQTWVLFAGAPAFSFQRMFDSPRRWNVPTTAAVVLIGVMPSLNLVNRWDSALSFNVYSGNISVAEIHLWGDAVERLPPELREHAETTFGHTVLPLNTWSLSEFNSHVYPQDRIFKAIFRRLGEHLPEDSVELHVHEKGGWFFPKSTHVYELSDL